MSLLTHLLRRSCALLLVSCAAVLAVGCGGGVGNGGTGITDDGGGIGTIIKLPPTGPGFLHGPVTGLGPLMVDGVRVEHLWGLVEDDDGNRIDPLELQLGMVVSVEGSPIVNGAIDIADTIIVHTDLHGQVTTAYDPATRRVGVLGQVVQVDANTVIDTLRGGLDDLGVGREVVVSGLLDPVTGVYLATRISAGDGGEIFLTRGAIADVDTAAATLRIGAQVFDYGGLALPPLFGAGQIVRVRFDPTPTAAGHWVATAVEDGSDPPQEGYVGDWRDVVGSVIGEPGFFYAGGLPVDASTARFLPAGTPIAPGMRVQVFGAIKDGVLVAYEVDVLAAGDAGAQVGDAFTIAGRLSTKIDGRGHTFSLLGAMVIDYSSASFVGGSADDLDSYTGVLEVWGPLAPGGASLQAVQVTFDSPPTGGGGGTQGKGGR